ncbi:14168_t:CDS:1, partial [Cetraspora pellucida]
MVDFNTSRVFTNPLACKATSTLRQKQFISGPHCFFARASIIPDSLCLFSNDDTDINGDSDNAHDEAGDKAGDDV